MIGIVGSAPAVDLVEMVARRSHMRDQYLAATCSDPRQAIERARDLESKCPVLLFTGRNLYNWALSDGAWSAQLRFIPHSAADLYRTIGGMLLRAPGAMPSVSIDTVETSVVEEVFDELDLAPPSHILPETDMPLEVDAQKVLRFHLDLLARGLVDCSLTCLHTVYRSLSERGLPAVRVHHSKAGVRDALRQALLLESLLRARSSQPAVVLLEPRSASTESPARAHAAALSVARDTRGRVEEAPNGRFVVHTVRTAIEDLLVREARGATNVLLTFNVSAGFGVDVAGEPALQNARLSLDFRLGYGHWRLVGPHGEVSDYQLAHGTTHSSLREQSAVQLELAKAAGLNPRTIVRVIALLKTMDFRSVTVADLAQAYQVQPRTARRILQALKTAGLAEIVGSQSPARAGRPRLVYHVDVARM